MTKSFEQRTAFYLAFELAYSLDNARNYFPRREHNPILYRRWREHMAKVEQVRELALTLFNTVGMNKDSSMEDILTELNTITSGVPQERHLSPQADEMFVEYL